MSNTLTNLLPDMYEALDVVSREMTGFIPAVNRDSDVSRAAIGQTVYVPETEEPTGADNTPAVNAPDTGDATVDGIPVAITKSKHWPVRWNGEETKGLQNAGTFSSIQAQRFYNAMRAAVNEIEADLWAEAYQSASRVYGTAGTTPFASGGDLSDFAGALRILEENGAPRNDLQMVLGHSAIGNLRGKQSGLFKVNEAGSDDMLRNGMTDRIMNFAIRHSDAVSLHTAGAGAASDLSPSYLVDNGAGYAVGATDVNIDTGTGAINAGDVFEFGADGNKYVITGAEDGGADTLLNLGKPGLVTAIADGDTAIGFGNYTPNLAFARSAIVLATRAPAMPQDGDSATAVEMVVDDRTGLTFEVALYKQFLQNVFHVRIAWGKKAIKPAHIAVLAG